MTDGAAHPTAPCRDSRDLDTALDQGDSDGRADGGGVAEDPEACREAGSDGCR